MDRIIPTATMHVSHETIYQSLFVQGRGDDDDSGNSPLSIIEIPHLRAAVGCC